VRVLITPEWYPDAARPYFGVFCREQARAAARAHDVVVLTWKYDSTLRLPFRIERFVDEGVRTFRVRFRGTRVPKTPGAFKLAGIAAVLLELRRQGWKPDVVHAHEYVAGRVALLIGRVLRRSVVVSEHYSGFVEDNLNEHQKAMARDVFARADIVCPVSQDLERRLRVLTPEGRFETVANVIDESVFHPPAGPKHRRDDVSLVTVGQLIERKGHAQLVEALSVLESCPSATLTVVGEGPCGNELRSLTASLDLETRVRFLGGQPKHRIADILRGSDVFVLPSLSENLPCALLEALACGLPVVASRVGGVPEIIDDGLGVTVEPGSTHALAAGIDTVVSRLDRYDQTHIAATARSKYGYHAVAEQWSGVYSAVGGPRP
jgi:glycosyltransferase involved in cell wall biosynthesis